VVGQELVTTTLKNAVSMSRVSHAYLLHGPRGTGKTSTARILAKAVNCLAPKDGEPCNSCRLCLEALAGRSLDIIEIDGASNRGIADIKGIIEKMQYSPTQGQFKTYIIDEVHQLTSFAADALLKTLEEPPPHVLLVLATTEPESIPITIISRCQQFSFLPVSTTAIANRLQIICDAENIPAEPIALEKIAYSAAGSLRDAQNLLEQASLTVGASLDATNISASLNIDTDIAALDLATSALRGDVASGLQLIHATYSQGRDTRRYERSLINYLRHIMRISSGATHDQSYTEIELDRMKSIAHDYSLSEIHSTLQIFTNSINEQYEEFPTLGLELALVSSSLQLSKEDEPAQRIPTVTTTIPSNDLKANYPGPITEFISTDEANPERESRTETRADIPGSSPQPKITDTSQEIINSWNLLTDEFKGQKGKKKAVDLGGLLRTSQKQEIMNDELVLIYKYASNRDWLLSELNDPSTRAKLEEAAARFFGVTKVKAITLEELQLRKSHPPTAGHLVSLAQQLGGRVINETPTNHITKE
jgi:DNA polymerase-3 subunit gamma/tau